jgi:hypothetical protein
MAPPTRGIVVSGRVIVAKEYVLKRTAEERAELQGLVRKGRVVGWKVQRTHDLLP